MRAKLEESILRVTSWVEKHGYKAYDPGDGNNSYLHFFTFNNLLLERLLQQSVYRAPFNLRPLYGIKPHTSTKGMGYMAWGYLKMYGLRKDPSYKDRAVKCLEWVMNNRSPGYSQYCWGNHFPFCTRGGKTPKLEPIIPWSTLIGQAFLEAYHVLGDAKYLEVASSVCDWILAVPREKTATGTCLSYVAFKQNSIHNSNMLAAALLAQVAAAAGRANLLEVAREAMTYSCSRQREDGSWYYGEDPKYYWIDSFHTGYNLDSLKRYQQSSGDRTFNGHLRRGFEYFKGNFFEPNGIPKYYHNKVHPIDSQCAGQAIDTLTYFSEEESLALELAQKVASWTMDHMQDRDGHFYYRDLGWAVNKTPMLHWGQGVMFKALAHLLSKLQVVKATPQAAETSLR
jgi:rhamnogalacturonyl hydrolase YesR